MSLPCDRIAGDALVSASRVARAGAASGLGYAATVTIRVALPAKSQQRTYTPQVLPGCERESVARRFFLSSAHTSPAHLSVIGGDFVLESVVRCAAFVRYSEFGGCPLFGSRKCTASTGRAVGTSTVVRYSEEVRYWEGPLSEVPLYTSFHVEKTSSYIPVFFQGSTSHHKLSL